jgi:hypothetical protein
MNDETKEKIATLLREERPEIPEDAFLSHWFIVTEWSSGDSDFIANYSDGVTSLSGKLGLLQTGIRALLDD